MLTTSEKEKEQVANSLLPLDHRDGWTARTQFRTDCWASLKKWGWLPQILRGLQFYLPWKEPRCLVGSEATSRPKLQLIYFNTRTLLKLASEPLIAHLPTKVSHLMHSMLTIWMSILVAPLKSSCIPPSSLSTIHLLNLNNLILKACHKTWSTQPITQNRSCEDC